MKFEKSCGAVVYRYTSEQYCFLLVKHKNGGHWDFPKGHIENNENSEETAKREVYEETGIFVELHDGFCEKVKYRPEKDVLKEVIFFLGRSLNCEVKYQTEEIDDFGWFKYGESFERLTFDSSRAILKKVFSFLESGGN